MTETLEVVGKVTGIETKASGFSIISVQPEGKQYPVKVGTKRPEVIEQATEALGWPAATVTYSESDSDNMNPHTGEPYKNRFAVSFLPVTPADQAKAAAAKTQHRLPLAPVEQSAIARATAIKAAFSVAAPGLATALIESQRTAWKAWVFQLAGEIEAWLTRAPDAQEAVTSVPVAGGDAAAAPAGGSAAAPPSHDPDDDIPF